MTIAAGFKCHDGIVLATDTQYSVSGLKVAGQKLFTLNPSKSLTLCIAGAGSVAFLKMTVEMLVEKLKREHPEPRLRWVQDTLKEVLLEVFNQHIYPIPNTPYSDLQLLVGIWDQTEGLALIATEQTAIFDVPTYFCIGAGNYLAQYLMDQLWGYGTFTEQVKFLAMHIIDVTKEYVEFCGKETAIHILSESGDVTSIDPSEIRDAEDYFSELTRAMKYLLTCLSSWSSDNFMPDVIAESIKDQITAFRDKQRKRWDAQNRAQPPPASGDQT